MIKTFVNDMQLPINPFDEIVVKRTGNNEQYDIVSMGEVTSIGKSKLATLEFKSLFTSNIYPFSMLSDPRPPKEYIDAINGYMDNQQPIRLIITGDGVDINMLFSIESFQTTQAFGETNEYYYQLSLKEYREPTVKRVELPKVKTEAIPQADVPQAVRSESPPEVTTYTVQSGDCLWTIAEQYYGDGSMYTQIYDANTDQIDNPDLIYPGQVLVIP